MTILKHHITECYELRNDFKQYEPQYKQLTKTICSLERELQKLNERKEKGIKA